MVAGVLLAGCRGGSLPPPEIVPAPYYAVRVPTGTVTGQVIDARSKKGLPNIVVQVQNVTPPAAASTREDGTFVLGGVPQGNQIVVIDMVGYRVTEPAGNIIAQVLPDGTSSIGPIALETPGSSPCPAALDPQVDVKGKVYDQGGKPVSGLATITVESLDASVPFRATATTDATGSFGVYNLPEQAPLRVVAQVNCGPRAVRQLTAPRCGTVQLGFGGPASPADPEAPQYFLWVEPGAPSSSPCPLPSWSGL
jgi:hypothetical protein